MDTLLIYHMVLTTRIGKKVRTTIETKLMSNNLIRYNFLENKSMFSQFL